MASPDESASASPFDIPASINCVWCLLSRLCRMTCPHTTLIADATFRIDVYADNPAAISVGASFVWMATKGAWKSGPIPAPAMIW